MIRVKSFLPVLATLMTLGAFFTPWTIAHSTEMRLSGPLTQGSMIVGQVTPGSKVELDGTLLKVSDEGMFVFGLGRDATKSAVLVVATPGAEASRHPLTIVPRDYDIQRIEGLPPSKVTPPPERQARLKRERGMVAASRSHSTNDLFWAEPFIWPASGRISGVYGSQRILNGIPKRPHYGLDVAGPVGTPVVAPAGGTVRLAQADFYYEGGIVIIDHGFGVSSTLFHLHSVDIEAGASVEQGQQIGTIGQSGRATGPHVDWRLNWQGERLDPQLLLGDTLPED